MSKQAIGVVGLAVMGSNLALNIESRGHAVSVYNRSREKTDELMKAHPDKKLVPLTRSRNSWNRLKSRAASC